MGKKHFKKAANLISKVIICAIISLQIMTIYVWADNNKIDDIYCNVKESGSYTIGNSENLPSGVSVLNVKINKKIVEDREITKPGNYEIELECSDSNIYTYNLYCYQKADANVDGNVDVRDLISARKSDITVAGRISADMDNNGTINARDFSLIRAAILGKNITGGVEQPLPTADELDGVMEVKEVTVVDSQAAITLRNTSLVWETSKDACALVEYYDSDGVRLGNDKIDIGIVEPTETKKYQIRVSDSTVVVKITAIQSEYWSTTMK